MFKNGMVLQNLEFERNNKDAVTLKRENPESISNIRKIL